MTERGEAELREIDVVYRELESRGVYASTTSGTSMWPLFKTHRDVVVLEKPKKAPKKYDVVLYPGVAGKFLLHRIIGERGDCYLIRGDNTYRTEVVPKSEIIAVLTAFNRKGKHHTPDEKRYQRYIRIWNFVYPIRYALNLVRRLLSKIKHKILGR